MNNLSNSFPTDPLRDTDMFNPTAEILEKVERTVRDLDLKRRVDTHSLLQDPRKSPWVSIYPPFQDDQTTKATDPTSMRRDWLKQKRSEVAFLYFHLPFCPRRCDFCYFDVSTELAHAESYIDRIIAEASTFLDHVNGSARVDHLYVGGGTPSAVRTDLVIRLLDSLHNCLPQEAFARATMEVHPHYVRNDFEHVLSTGTINRISIGVQTTNSAVLTKVGRKPVTEPEVVALCKRARTAGAREINVDFMVGLHHQTTADTLADLLMIDRLIRNGLVDSVTAYPRSYSRDSRIFEYESVTPSSLLDRMRMQLCYKEYFHAQADWREYPSYFFSRKQSDPMHPSSTSSTSVAKIGFGNSSYSFFDGSNYRNSVGVSDYCATLDKHGGATSNDESARRRLVFGTKSGVLRLEPGGSSEWRGAVGAWLDIQAERGLLNRDGDSACLTTLGTLFVEALIYDLESVLHPGIRY
jgi:coproporphyrinogen III oxidase-like Fe-S oxidoreductase